ncbi:MAG: hypothetical protein WCJ30_16970, partial [Deltaproteobacteria bacterium]
MLQPIAIVATRGSLLVAGCSLLLAMEVSACRRTSASPVTPTPSPASTDAASRAVVPPDPTPEVASPLESVGVAPRVVLSRARIACDAAALSGTWPAEFRDAAGAVALQTSLALQDGLVPAEQKRGGAWGFLINPLNQWFGELIAVERRYAEARSSPPRNTINLWIAPDVPYRAVYETLYTAGQNAFTSFRFVAHLADGSPTALEVLAARSEPGPRQDGGVASRRELAADALAEQAAQRALEALSALEPHTGASGRPATAAAAVAHDAGGAAPTVEIDAGDVITVRVTAAGYDL